MRTGVLVPHRVAVMAGMPPDVLAGTVVRAEVSGGSALLVDLAAVADGPGGVPAAEQIYTYLEHVRGAPPDRAGVPACETLVDVSQVARGDRRCDLAEEAEALTFLPGFGNYFEILAGARPDRSQLRRAQVGLRVDLLAGTVPRNGGKGRAVVEWRTSAAIPWPAVLGGGSRLAERERSILVEIRWAPWRDRRTRRLSRVAVRSHQTWPSAAGLL